MEANEKTMTVPDGWEFDHLDECGNIVLKEKKKELPKTWAGCLRIVDDAEMIDVASASQCSPSASCSYAATHGGSNWGGSPTGRIIV